MISIKWISFIGLLLFVSACKNDPSANNGQQQVPDDTTAVSAHQLSEDDILLQLSPYLIGEPGNLAEKEQNEIIDYAIDKLLPLERTNTGLFYQIIEEGQGTPLEWGDYIQAHYKGYFLDGKVFDSSYRRDQPLAFYIGNMIPGWNEGLQLLKPGGKMRLLIPSALAYGTKGFPDGKDRYLVPPDQVLAFEIEVIKKIDK